MRNIIRKIIRKIYYYLPIKFLLKNYILFESNPDYADNTYYVYKQLLKEGYNDKYKLIWLVNNKDEFCDVSIKNVMFVNFGSKEAKKYQKLAKFIIDSNKYVDKYNIHQYRIYLGHGMPIKFVASYAKNYGRLDNFLMTSPYFFRIFVDQIGVPRDILLSLGFPRNDQFFMKKEHFKEIDGFDKIILWMPTYRKHVGGSGYESKLPYGVPSINNEDELLKINKMLSKFKSLLLIKLHPAEDVSFLKKMKLTNIMFTKNELLSDGHKNIYQLAQLTDALITDYSSMYFDYMLLDKPIGMAVEDIDEYKRNFPLFFDDFEKELPGEYIYGYDDLVTFLDNVCHGKDIKHDERNKMRQEYFTYNDGDASRRIVEELKKHSL